MLLTLLACYVGIGLITALVTLRVFPPMEGFRPNLGLRLLAVVVFVTLWPLLVSLALWYLTIGHLGRTHERAETTEPPMAGLDLAGPGQMQTAHASKPR